MFQKNVVGIITTVQWNYDNKPTSITRDNITVSFTYDGNNQRVKKTAPNLTVYYFGEGYEKRGGVGIIHLFAGNQRIASVRSDGNTQFYHPDHLGSSWIVTDGNGAIKEKNEFYPFGTYLDSFTSYPFPPANYTFTGQEEDDEVGFYNYNARLYDPVLGRFISPDSIVPDSEDPQSLNHYSYVRNNPLKYIDPTGNFDLGDIGSFFTGLWDSVTGLLGFSSDSNSNSSFWEFSSSSSSNSFKGPTFDIYMPNLVDDAKFFLMSLSFKAPSQLSYNPSKEDTSSRWSLQIDYSKAFDAKTNSQNVVQSSIPFSLGLSIRGIKAGVDMFAGGSGKMIGSIAGGITGVQLGIGIGAAAGFSGGGIIGGFALGWLGGKIGGLFDNPWDGQLNYDETLTEGLYLEKCH